MELKTKKTKFVLLGLNPVLTINEGVSSSRNRLSIQRLDPSVSKSIIGETVSGSVGGIPIKNWIVTDYLEDKGFGEEATLVIDDIRWYWQFYKMTEIFNIVKQEKVPTGTLGDARAGYFGPSYARLKYNKFTLVGSMGTFFKTDIEGTNAALVYDILEYLFNTDAKSLLNPRKTVELRKKLPKLLWSNSAKEQAKKYSLDNVINPAQSLSGWIANLITRASLRISVTPDNKLYCWYPLDKTDIKQVKTVIEKDLAVDGENIQDSGQLAKPRTLRVYFPRKDIIRLKQTRSTTDESGFRNVCILPFAIQTVNGDYEAGIPIPFESLVDGIGAKTTKVYQSFTYSEGKVTFSDPKNPFVSTEGTIKKVLKGMPKVLNYETFCKWFLFKPFLQTLFNVHQGVYSLLQKGTNAPGKLYAFNLRSQLLNSLQTHFRKTFQLGNMITEQMLQWEFQEPVESDYFSKFRKGSGCYADTVMMIKYPMVDIPMAFTNIIDTSDLSVMKNSPRIQLSGSGGSTGLFTISFTNQVYENFQEFIIGRTRDDVEIPNFSLYSAQWKQNLRNHKNQVQLNSTYNMYIDITVVHPKTPVFPVEITLYSDGDPDFTVEKYSDALTASFDHRRLGHSDPLLDWIGASRELEYPDNMESNSLGDLINYVNYFIKPKVLQAFDSQVMGSKTMLWADAKSLLKKNQMLGNITSITYNDGSDEGVTIRCTPAKYPIDPTQLSPRARFAVFQSLGMNGIGGK